MGDECKPIVMSLVSRRKRAAANALMDFIFSKNRFVVKPDTGAIADGTDLHYLGNVIDWICAATVKTPAKPPGWDTFLQFLIKENVPLAMISEPTVAQEVRELQLQNYNKVPAKKKKLTKEQYAEMVDIFTGKKTI